MENINTQEVLNDMLVAARTAFDKDWEKVSDYAKAELEKLTMTFTQIEILSRTGQITPAESSVLFEMQKNTARAVMAGLEGMSTIIVENALNAALNVVRDAINRALGFVLL
ncbi:MAG: hypothetical protein IV101_13350 [Dechloromonas sp.]|uniref:hypothetical protein n=1 Tax=Dechloromonas sp. TaxID=1917218 RepID=UPI0027F884B7|nr:hypothetical protein [Dechloromonas sp.]MBT9521865.1 hypothetical protein [Dechloromonas sp.]